MKKKLIILSIIVLLAILTIYLINTNNPINQYKKDAIEILNSLKSRDISVQQAENEIGTLQKKFENTYKNKIENSNDSQHMSYSLFNLHLSTLKTSLYLDTTNGITNVKINEYIEQIKNN